LPYHIKERYTLDLASKNGEEESSTLPSLGANQRPERKPLVLSEKEEPNAVLFLHGSSQILQNHHPSEDLETRRTA
jgi:hypothetical protein